MDILTEDLINEEFETESLLSVEGESSVLSSETVSLLNSITIILFVFCAYTIVHNSITRLFYVGGR